MSISEQSNQGDVTFRSAQPRWCHLQISSRLKVTFISGQLRWRHLQIGSTKVTSLSDWVFLVLKASFLPLEAFFLPSLGSFLPFLGSFLPSYPLKLPSFLSLEASFLPVLGSFLPSFPWKLIITISELTICFDTIVLCSTRWRPPLTRDTTTRCLGSAQTSASTSVKTHFLLSFCLRQ